MGVKWVYIAETRECRCHHTELVMGFEERGHILDVARIRLGEVCEMEV